MTKHYFKLLFLLLFVNQLLAQQKNLWSGIDEAKIGNRQLQLKQHVKKYKTFQLEYADLKGDLVHAPKKNVLLKRSELVLKFPDENGDFISFKVKEMPVMHSDLAIKYPNNKSYIGVGVDDSSKKIRFSVNEEGLHAVIIGSDKKVQYIDPVTSDKKYYKVYKRDDMDFDLRTFQCLTNNIPSLKKGSLAKKASNDLKLRTFRLALAATGEYSQFHINRAGVGSGTDAEKKAAVLAAMTTALTRVDAVFENDLSITMQLVANTDDLIYLDAASDPYTNNDGEAMLNQNQTTCDNVIGSVNYDIGHVFSTGGGGVAKRASICTASKAKGVTGSLNPIGDLFYFDFVAHEMGHQLGANHTFNGDSGNCSGDNREDATAVEPGSGSTLMAYAGLCSPQNVQSHSDLYFHIISIEEIWSNIVSGSGTCANITNLTGNLNVPTANAGVDFVLPKSTPYILKGQGSDADGDPISFCWEQIDNEITDIPPKETSVAGALYRSVNPKTIGNRYLPELSTIVNGSLSSNWEVTPSVAREINFKLTVRDNNAEAGQIATDNLKVTVTDAAGPFSVTSQSVAGLVWEENTPEIITWNVAGTSSNNINVAKVNILMSVDGGKTFPVVLLSNTPNDGSQSITVPNTPAAKCFVMVEAVNSFFYSINSKVFSIGEFNEVCETYIAIDTPAVIPDNDPEGVTSSINITENLNIEKVMVDVKINHSYVSDVTLTLESPNGTVVELLSGACDASNDIDATFDDSGDDMVCSGTPVISGIIKPSQALFALKGEASNGIWKLKAVDGAEADNGNLESWSIEICTSEPVLQINNYVFSNFKVYPNPSNGIFNLEFNSKNTSDVEISVFDMMGRSILKRVFKNKSTKFKENINIQNISSGIYILQVKRGNEISSQKLRIN
jgi:subtilisin-like proprotein convertase family protein